MISLRHLSLGYRSATLLDDVAAEFPQGTLTALIGRNGTGKSTLLRALAGLNPHYSGEILIDGTPLRELKGPELARRMAFVNTERTRIPNLRCRDVVAMGRAPYTNWIGRLADTDRQAVSDALRAINMEDYADRHMDRMSDGECQRIMIARALAQDTPNILLDEPTSFLDLPNRYRLVELLSQLAHTRNKCIIFSTHELDIALRRADRIALLADRTLYNLTAREMADSGLIPAKFGITL
ncbi:MAG: ABC transporter ATP-binding protein [Muribaculaceae bacterium]|nr:ABC transporter ATP-binding protein [Muribaculaceae bacterium]MDE7081873.1 ABC transporter ATP-binding protein [Muribaculaceae bacterium]